jgi:DDE superfamily endonuclease
VLLVDGHNSHYTKGFLEYARNHNIHVLCYPAHATHVYQGLDVAVFSVLKRYWAEEREKWEREKGEKVNKENFLAVYGAAHVRALTPEIIRSAFRKTGVWPYDPSVVTTDMMAPSLESSNRGHLPLVPSTPVRIVSTLIRKITDDAENPFMDHSPGVPSMIASVGVALHSLASTSAGFLVDDSPIRSTSRLPAAPILPVSAQKKISRNQALLNAEPTTELEKLLQHALHESETREAYQKERVIELQSTVILQEKYLDRVRHQLEAQEGKKNKGKSTKLVGDGWPRLLTGDTFYTKVIEHQLMQRELADAKELRREEREKKAKATADWKSKDDERKKRNEEKRGKWKEAVASWELERDRAKLTKQRPAWKKPILGKMEIAAPRPKAPALADIDEENEDEDNSEDEDDEGDNE